MRKPAAVANGTAAGTAAPESSANKQCSICKNTFPSRTALFKHLRSGACDARLARAPTKANATLQLGYRGASMEDVERALQAAIGVGTVRGRTGAASATRGHLALAAGASSWGDVCACCLPPCDDVERWVAEANVRAGGIVEILRRAPLLPNFNADACSLQRVEVLVPSKYISDLRAFRDAATALLIEKRGNRSVARSWHAFCDDALPLSTRRCTPGDQSSQCTVKKVNVKKYDEDWVVVALEADRFLRGMARRAVSLAVFAHNGIISDVSLADGPGVVRPWASDILESLGPSIDAKSEGLACCKYAACERVSTLAVDAVRAGAGAATLLFRDACRTYGACDAVEASWAAAEAYWRALRPVPQTLPEPQIQTPPAPYGDALTALRALTERGWPTSSLARSKLLVHAAGGSFSVGAMPTTHQPARNAEADVVAAVFALERALIATHFPDRAPSTMCAVNRAARFRPHLDAGAGFGQRTSLIVGLGDYTGGDLVVERVSKDIRYAPLQFDGWRERHWTRSFAGERFSLVWFTPLAVAAPNALKPPPPPFVLAAPLPVDLPTPSKRQIIELLAPACVVVRGFLDVAAQRDVVAAVAAHAPAFEARFYEGGGALKCRTVCLGSHDWDHAKNAYASTAGAVPAVLADYARRAHEAAAAADADLPAYDAPDVVLCNFYDKAGRMGLHRDDAESSEALARGSPVVSLSFGDDAVFAMAPSRDAGRTRVTLRSGDALVFGGPSRLIYHGVERVKSGTAPAALGMRPGRLNLTFRATE